MKMNQNDRITFGFILLSLGLPIATILWLLVSILYSPLVGTVFVGFFMMNILLLFVCVSGE
jgi:hypothetical protein